MHIFKNVSHIDFLGMRHKFFLVSALLIGASAASLAVYGVKYSIDFTGGMAIDVSFDKPVELKDLRAAAAKIGWANAALQHYTGSNAFSIRVQSGAQASAEQVDQQLAALAAALPQAKMTIDNKSYVGPAVGRDLFRKALWAIVLSLLGIVVYVAFRFDDPIWGVAHIVALLHTLIATFGLFSFLGIEIDLLAISAMLTVGGYAIHDTIIVFDRMREKIRLVSNKASLYDIMNESMNETLSRTVITSMTVFVVVAILYFFGGQVIHYFALAMVFGTMVGTYSSVAVATPLVYEWSVRHQKRPQAAALAAAKPASNNKPGLKPVAKPKPAGNKG